MKQLGKLMLVFVVFVSAIFTYINPEAQADKMIIGKKLKSVEN